MFCNWYQCYYAELCCQPSVYWSENGSVANVVLTGACTATD